MIEVSNRIEVSLGSESFNQFTDLKVKFEELKKGAVVKYDAFINARENYNLEIKSINGGKLGHHLDQIKTTINYQIYLDDQQIQFDDNGEFKKWVEKKSSNSKSSHQIKLILDETNHAFKGNYSDRISIKAYN